MAGLGAAPGLWGMLSRTGSGGFGPCPSVLSSCLSDPLLHCPPVLLSLCLAVPLSRLSCCPSVSPSSCPPVSLSHSPSVHLTPSHAVPLSLSCRAVPAHPCSPPQCLPPSAGSAASAAAPGAPGFAVLSPKAALSLGSQAHGALLPLHPASGGMRHFIPTLPGCSMCAVSSLQHHLQSWVCSFVSRRLALPLPPW